MGSELPYLKLGIEEHCVQGHFHAKGVYRFARRYPETRFSVKIGNPEQASPPGGTGACYRDTCCKRQSTSYVFNDVLPILRQGLPMCMVGRHPAKSRSAGANPGGSSLPA